MGSNPTDSDFTVWGADHAAYGPVDLPILVSWIQGERVTADTWIHDAKNGIWRKAAQVPELQMFFRKKTGASSAARAVSSLSGIEPGALRRVKIMAGMTDEQLARFADFMEIENVPPWHVLVKQGDSDSTMYLILEGEFRVRVNIGGKETILATLGMGEFFGDISLFDHGPRSADVVANAESVVLKVSSEAFDKLAAEAPELATPFLLAVGKTLAARIRYDNKRYSDAVKFARASV
jgi:CRP-like cAMP-binding protein